MTEKCAKCGSPQLDKGQLIAGRHVYFKPDAVDFVEFEKMRDVRAAVCTACGYTELFASQKPAEHH